MFTILLAFTMSAPPVSREDEDAAAAVAVELAKLNLQKSAPARKTLCACGKTGKCGCWDGECSCAACGRGAEVAAQAPKAPGSVTTDRTPVRTAAEPARPGTELGSSAVSRPADTSTSATYAMPAGFTSGCANGQCASPTQTRSRFRR